MASYRYIFLDGFVAEKRYGQRVRSDRNLEAKPPFVVCKTSVICIFQIDVSERDCRAIFFHYSS